MRSITEKHKTNRVEVIRQYSTKIPKVKFPVKENVEKPILIQSISLQPLKNIKEKVYLDNKGRIFSKTIEIKDNSHRNYRQMYYFSRDYLDAKRRRYSIEKFIRTDLHDIREMLWRKNKKTISRNVIEDIVHNQNQIADIRKAIKDRFRKYVLKAYDKKLDEEAVQRV